MKASRADVVSAVKAAFEDRHVLEVLRALDAYGVDPHEREPARVQLAILKLSGNDVEKVRYYAAVAKTDYRDVLLWAETPDLANGSESK
jgi:hypothetical protein